MKGKILERASLQQIQNFLLTGAENTETDGDLSSYKEIIGHYLDAITKLESLNLPKDQHKEILDYFIRALDTVVNRLTYFF